MCLAVPGKVVSTHTNALGMRVGSVSFGGIAKEVYLTLLPDVKVGDWVLVHAGVAINSVDEAEAAATLELLRQVGALDAEPVA